MTNITNAAGQPQSIAPAAVVALPTLLTQDEVAAYLRISPKTLERDRWLGQGLPFLKVGRSVRYRASDLLEFVEGDAA
ncbi:helix-turn-helix domain-containing protein [Primorskyibacter marinus]|uniref:helix-turn-helix domain-containing protein n=1 Tax=Primorskyibacter marinus TaxID=1977320 RepID=UPI000E309EF1|nr:helix-turn-helix domain-containing protein [Primorskyibacter marinus]